MKIYIINIQAGKGFTCVYSELEHTPCHLISNPKIRCYDCIYHKFNDYVYISSKYL